MNYKPLQIGDLIAERPIVQGGMGVGISLGNVAGAVAKEGGVGIISSAQIGFKEEDFENNPRLANKKAIKKEYEKARRISPNGIIGFNIMVALKDYREHVIEAAKAGADIIAPSDMMDLRVKAIREALDEAGFVYTPIMSYSAKFASGYYGPFRDAAHSAPGFGDRKTYQMDPANGQEALREIGEDIEEGADLIIAKPALAYMDIMKEASMKYNIPIVAYNVSGEYAMVKAAAANGWIDEKKIVMENMVGLKRAGAKMIITYHALDVAKWLKEEER